MKRKTPLESRNLKKCIECNHGFFDDILYYKYTCGNCKEHLNEKRYFSVRAIKLKKLVGQLNDPQSFYILVD